MVTTPVNLITLNEAYPNWASNAGVFDVLPDEVPWNGVKSASSLNILYFTHSGQKITGTLVDKFLENNVLSDTSRATIAECIWTMFSPNWQKLWDTYNLEYEILDSYSLTETHDLAYGKGTTETRDLTYSKGTTETRDLTYSKGTTESHDLQYGKGTTETRSLTDAKTGTESLAKTGTDATDTTITNDITQNDIYGFNSSTAVPSDISTRNSTGKETETLNLTDTTTYGVNNTETGTVSQSGSDTESGSISHSGSDTESGSVSHSGSDTESGSVSHSGSDTDIGTITKKGRIGMASPQSFVEEERNLWLRSYFEKVFSDIDSLLTCSVYINSTQVEEYY